MNSMKTACLALLLSQLTFKAAFLEGPVPAADAVRSGSTSEGMVFSLEVAEIMATPWRRPVAVNRSGPPTEEREQSMQQNNLAGSASPYLRQHADNPVWWQPWGEAAFAEAKRRDVPVLISIGYSTCHWCHVMAHESFEDPDLAAVMNQHFVCIKVDREEHPEVDEIYMDVCQSMTGSGGWPLHAIGDADGRPFFAGTYYPPAQWRQLLLRIAELWQQDRSSLQAQADRVFDWLQQEAAASVAELPEDVDRQFLIAIESQFDPVHPGLGQQPKFPPSTSLLAGLALWSSLSKVQQEMLLGILEAMQDSGLHDRVGGGFHRYSVDAQWRVPHFEKMLYDNALLMTAYAQAAQRSGRSDFLRSAVAIADYLQRDLRVCDADGRLLGYAAAEDADDPGGEGAFYAWSPTAIQDVLGARAARLVELWDVAPGQAPRGPSGHLEPVASHIPHPRGSAAFQALDPIAQEQERQAWQDALPRLRQARDQRPRPGRDDKVLTDLNGLALQGLAWVARVSGEQRWYQATAELAAVLVTREQGPDGLVRMPGRPAYITDYGHLLLGLTAAFQALGDPALIDRALAVGEAAHRQLAAADGGYYTTPAGRDDLIRRSREYIDTPAPSGSSALALGFARLGQLTGEERWLQRSRAAVQAAASTLHRLPHAAATAVQAWWRLRQGESHLVLAGPVHAELQAEARRLAPPGMQVVPADIERDWSCLHERRELAHSQALICLGQRCLAPATNAAELTARLSMAE